MLNEGGVMRIMLPVLTSAIARAIFPSLSRTAVMRLLSSMNFASLNTMMSDEWIAVINLPVEASKTCNRLSPPAPINTVATFEASGEISGVKYLVFRVSFFLFASFEVKDFDHAVISPTPPHVRLIRGINNLAIAVRVLIIQGNIFRPNSMFPLTIPNIKKLVDDEKWILDKVMSLQTSGKEKCNHLRSLL